LLGDLDVDVEVVGAEQIKNSFDLWDKNKNRRNLS